MVSRAKYKQMEKRFESPASCRTSFAKCSNRKGTRQHLGQRSKEEVPVSMGVHTFT